jgi:alpha-D-xyloside xylohydrolase
VFTGANGQFDLYEDDGTSYGYERGEYARILIRYDDHTHQLMIGERKGTYPGMVQTRTINVRWIKRGVIAAALDANSDQTVQYSGESITINQHD